MLKKREGEGREIKERQVEMYVLGKNIEIDKLYKF